MQTVGVQFGLMKRRGVLYVICVFELYSLDSKIVHKLENTFSWYLSLAKVLKQFKQVQAIDDE